MRSMIVDTSELTNEGCMNYQISPYSFDEPLSLAIDAVDITHKPTCVEFNSTINACYDMFGCLLKCCTNDLVIGLISDLIMIIEDIPVVSFGKSLIDFHRIASDLLYEFAKTRKYSMVRFALQDVMVAIYEHIYDE